MVIPKISSIHPSNKYILQASHVTDIILGIADVRGQQRNRSCPLVAHSLVRRERIDRKSTGNQSEPRDSDLGDYLR